MRWNAWSSSPLPAHWLKLIQLAACLQALLHSCTPAVVSSTPYRLLGEPHDLSFVFIMSFVGRSFVVASLVALCRAGSIRGSSREEGRTISVEEVQAGLQAAMQTVLDGDDDSRMRSARIEERVWQTFQALPKNDVGRLTPRGVRYLVHNYFMKEHGWLIQGLDPHGNQANVSEVHEVSILRDKAPALVESLLEARRSNHGLALTDIVTMIAALERLIFDESLALLRAAYAFNDVSMFGEVEQSRVHDVLTSYLLLFQLGSKGNLSDARLHRALKARVSRRDDWPTVVDFQKDAVMNFNYAEKDTSNPFVEPRYTFEAGIGRMHHGQGVGSIYIYIFVYIHI